MSDLTLAASLGDAAVLAAAEEHHSHLAGELSGRVATLLAAAARDAAAADRIRHGLVTFCDTQLLPHTAAEETTLYAAAHRTVDGRLLIVSLLAEHGRITALVEALREAGDPLTAAADARALQVLVEEHVAAENGLVLPLLAMTPGVDLAALLTAMERAFEEEARAAETALAEAALSAVPPARAGLAGMPLPGAGVADTSLTEAGRSGTDLTEAALPDTPLTEAGPSGASVTEGVVPPPRPAGDGCCGGCTCGEAEADIPELDVREIPHALRHTTVFGALDALPAGRSLVLVAPHDPVPLLAQIDRRGPGRFAVRYLQRGPAAWRLLLSHRDR